MQRGRFMPGDAEVNATEAMQRLRGIHVTSDVVVDQAASIVMWPVMLAIGLIMLGALLYWLRRRSWRRSTNRELANIIDDLDAGLHQQAWQRLSLLTRRLAYLIDPSIAVRNATGTQWLAVLDNSLGTNCFVAGPGREIIRAPYTSSESSSGHNAREVVQALRERLPKLEPAAGDD